MFIAKQAVLRTGLFVPVDSSRPAAKGRPYV
jgi:hypothetical protein